MEHKKVKAIAFDLDHTLYDRYGTLRSIAYLLKQRYRNELNPKLSASQIGEMLVEMDKTYIYDGWPLMFEKLCEKGMFVNPPSFIEYFAFFMEAFQKIAIPFPMVEEMLQNFQKQGYKVGLLTNGEAAIQRGKVRMIGLEAAFDMILAGEEMGKVQKPDIHPFRKMAEHLGCTTDEMVYVGDNPLNDMEAARRAGCIPIWVKASGKDWNFPEYEKPCYEVNDILELPELLKQLEK